VGARCLLSSPACAEIVLSQPLWPAVIFRVQLVSKRQFLRRLGAVTNRIAYLGEMMALFLQRAIHGLPDPTHGSKAEPRVGRPDNWYPQPAGVDARATGGTRFRRWRQLCLGFVFFAVCAFTVCAAASASQVPAGSVTPTPAIYGQVRDNLQHPLKGVEITLREGGAKTLSDANGDFSIKVDATASQIHLQFTAPGYYAQAVTLDVKEQQTPLEISLSPVQVVREEVRVVASRLDVPLSQIPAAASVVSTTELSAMPRTMAADEALAGVAGMKIDNQANSERVHVSIRGQGILTESGIRGIEVLQDGIPLNDPSGFVPDLFDVDWAGVQEVNVVKGPVAFLYGGGSSGGIIDIRTRETSDDFHGNATAQGGSNGFYKGRVELSGKAGPIPFYLATARAAGDGYREHTAFYGDNIYAKFDLRPAPRLQLHTVLMGTGYFNQNPEGLNLQQVQEDPRQPNPDALTFNEYQKTQRFTGGVHGALALSERQHLGFTFYARHTEYKESVPSSVDHQNLTAPGGSAQYDLEGSTGPLKHHLSLGFDLDGQFIDEFRRPNLGNAVEDNVLVADQGINQSRVASYVTERLGLGPKWTALLGARMDRISNRLHDHLQAGGQDLSGERAFHRATGRVGLSYTPGKQVTLYTSWGQGFLPPSTEELDANPVALGGFNRALVPATSSGIETGMRGNIRGRLFYDAAFFHLDTKNDFERYRISSRPLETFYGNAGQSSRYGLETELRWMPTNRFTISGAYTYSHFTYTKYDSLTFSGNLVRNWLPNSPAQQLFTDASIELPRQLVLGAGVTAFSRAFIDPTNSTWIDGYGLLHASLSKAWQFRSVRSKLFVAGRNLTDKKYIAFTEPDPDGNSYQPGPRREIFSGVQVNF
jgi:iron complex outermembrane receptor protein